MKEQEHIQHLAAAANVLWQLIQANEMDPEDLFRKGGIDPGLLKKPQARVSCRKMNHLWDLVSQKMPDPCFAVHAGEYWHPSHLHALGYTWLVSATLKESLEKLVRYSRVLSETMTLSLKETDHGATLVYHYHPDTPPQNNRRVAALSVILAMCRINCGKNLAPLEVAFAIDPPPCMDIFHTYFRSRIRFLCKQDSITFARKDLDRPLPSANSLLAKLNDQVIADYLAHLDAGTLAQQVKSGITEVLSSGKVTDDLIAKKLHMSVRSFQRQLQKRGTTFRSLLDKTREEIALGYIKDPEIRLEEIAFLTGFSEYSSFSRAFKRWTGSPPSRVRSDQIRSERVR